MESSFQVTYQQKSIIINLNEMQFPLNHNCCSCWQTWQIHSSHLLVLDDPILVIFSALKLQSASRNVTVSSKQTTSRPAVLNLVPAMSTSSFFNNKYLSRLLPDPPRLHAPVSNGSQTLRFSLPIVQIQACNHCISVSFEI
jgi:hypothetical protein